VTEQPQKIPFYAALLRELHEPAEPEGEDAPLGARILAELARGFRGYLDTLAWRETRFCVRALAVWVGRC
jgi:nuclear cap-binding protein subunit 1